MCYLKDRSVFTVIRLTLLKHLLVCFCKYWLLSHRLKPKTLYQEHSYLLCMLLSIKCIVYQMRYWNVQKSMCTTEEWTCVSFRDFYTLMKDETQMWRKSSWTRLTLTLNSWLDSRSVAVDGSFEVSFKIRWTRLFISGLMVQGSESSTGLEKQKTIQLFWIFQ